MGPRAGPRGPTWLTSKPGVGAAAVVSRPLPASKVPDEVHFFLRIWGVTAIYGVNLVRLPSETPDDPCRPKVLSSTGGWQLWRTKYAKLVTNHPIQADGLQMASDPPNVTIQAYLPTTGTAQHCPRDTTGAPGSGRDDLERPAWRHAQSTLHVPDCIAKMLDSDCSPQQDDRLHRWSRSPSPVSPGSGGVTPAERDERRLAEAAATAELLSKRLWVALGDSEPPALEQAAASPATQAPASSAPKASGAVTQQAPDALPGRPRGAAAAGKQSRKDTKYHTHTQPSHTWLGPLKLYPPKGPRAFGALS